MQKIMFNEQYGLQQATFDGSKTMTRRIVPNKTLDKWYEFEEFYRMTAPTPTDMCYIEPMEDFLIRHAPYKVGEIVAVAQRYSQLEEEIERQGLPLDLKESKKKHKGYNNKMFVRAEDMPHRIKITDRRLEHMQDISDEDCLREGIICKHIDSNSYTVGNFLLWDRYLRQRAFDSPKKAFEVLIRNISGDKAWDSNPLVYVYTYEMVD